MRKFIILLSVLSLSFTPMQDDFCTGWDVGYCEGWEYVKGRYSRCPRVPMCPRPKIFENAYNDGYNRGFSTGKYDAIESR